jgi:ABC-2 type transport system ATP-binding protein
VGINNYPTVTYHNPSKSYDKQEVLNFPDLVLESGKIKGIVGNNGAGKTTFLRATYPA